MDGHGQSVGGGEADAVWVSISELARLKGTSKQAISKRVKRFVENKVLEIRDGDGGKVLVNYTRYDRAIGATTDRSRWVSLSEMARIKATTRQAVSKRVKRLLGSHLLQTMPGKGGEVLVDRLAYDQAITSSIAQAQEATSAAAAVAAADKREPPNFNSGEK